MNHNFDFPLISDDEILLRIKTMPKRRYKRFRRWLWESKGWYTRMGLTLKPEYLREYYFEFIDLFPEVPNE